MKNWLKANNNTFMSAKLFFAMMDASPQVNRIALGQVFDSTFEMFKRRWLDFNFCEKGGENLLQTQIRNIDAINDVINHSSILPLNYKGNRGL